MDIVVFGATGFVGRLVARYLAEHAPAGVTIGLAGRSPEKLELTAAELSVDWPLVVPTYPTRRRWRRWRAAPGWWRRRLARTGRPA